MGSGADLRTCLILGFLLSSHDMVTFVMHSKDERIRNAASGIQTNACELSAEFVSFKIDHPCLKMDTFSMS